MSQTDRPAQFSQSPAYRDVDFWTSIAIAYLPIAAKIVIALASGNDIPAKVSASVLASIKTTPNLLAALTLFALTLLVLHGLLGFLAWRLWRPIQQRLARTGHQNRLLAMLFFMMLQGGILGCNSLLFPNSALRVTVPWLFIALSGLSLSAVLLYRLVQWSDRASPQKWARGWVLIPAVALLAGAVLMPTNADHRTAARRDKPDIIIIGLDSLRPDHLKQTSDVNTITPNLDAILADGYRLERTYTPMARTYPAWMSILTGRYPVEHGARFNLLDPKYLRDRQRSLPFVLKAKGYQTVYSIDETRFSNIDNSYGFDITVTPAIGAADFLTASAADLPLRNLLSLVPKLSAALFPYQFINRAVHGSYEPTSFDNALINTIANADPQKPLFLVTHFELPHWPYDWRESVNYSVAKNPRLETLSPITYHKSVQRADEQFGSLIETLKLNDRLNNAIVVVLSDHGEGFNQSAPNWQAGSNKLLMDIPSFNGHGINVIDEAQIRVLLAFKRFGGKNIPTGNSQQLTSLVDIAPTLLSVAGFDKAELKASGCDLFSAEVEDDCGNNRIVFTESGFYVPAMLTPGGLDEKKIAEQAQAYYDINPDTRLTFKTSALPQMFKDKQRAAIGDNWVVASLPQYGHKQFLAGNFNNHTYWNIDKIQIDKIGAIPKALLPTLCQKYQGDDADLDEFCRRS